MLEPTSKILSILGFRPTGDLGPLTAYTSGRGRVVWFLKAPPTTPPSEWQLHYRNAFRLIGHAWSALQPAERLQWSLAEHRGKLTITGYDLFVYWNMTQDDAAIRAIQRQTNTTLIP
jgi:hypothetical protein